MLIAQQLALIIVIRLANDLGGKGAVGVYTYAWALYQLPLAVLAVPIATSSFPCCPPGPPTGTRQDSTA
ncbi:hypothetical protein ACFQX6_20865 [Streptosporangium lutulentum]